MGGIFSAPSTPAVVEAPPPPTRSDTEVRDAALQERQRRAAATGRSATINTSPTGTNEDAAPTVSKKLLGN